MNNLAVQMHLANREDSKSLREENDELLRIIGAIILSNDGNISLR